MKLMVTSAGGPAAVGVIKSLEKFDGQGEHHITATDITADSAGMYMADTGYIVPKSTDKEFIPEIRKIIEKEKIDVLLPTGNMEIDKFESLSDITNVFMSNSDTIKLCNDKWKFYNKVKDDFDLPKTWSDKDMNFKNSIARPRYELGGSKGVFHCEDVHQYLSTFHSDVEYIYSDYLPGQEYTVDVLCGYVAVVRKRVQTKAGISTQGEIVRDEYIENECMRMCKFLGLKGPVCIQLKEDKNGVPKFIEVNPRFGGGTYFTTLAGVNFVEIIIRILENKEIFISEPKPIKVIRHFKEIVRY